MGCGRRIALAALVVLANVILVGLFASLYNWPSLGTHSLVMFLTLGFFAVPGVAMWWMFYDALRYERRPWPYLLLALVPYSFIWHYFERTRKRTPGGQSGQRPFVDVRAEASGHIPPGGRPRTLQQESDLTSKVRTGLWICVSLAATIFATYVVVGPWRPRAALDLVLLVFVVHPFGAFWMIYRCIRYEERPLPLAFAALIPYSFLWYYFERVRKEVGTPTAPE